MGGCRHTTRGGVEPPSTPKRVGSRSGQKKREGYAVALPSTALARRPSKSASFTAAGAAVKEADLEGLLARAVEGRATA